MSVKTGEKITAVQGRGLVVLIDNLPAGVMEFCLSLPGDDGQCYVRSVMGARSGTVTRFVLPANYITMLGVGWNWHVIDGTGAAIVAGLMDVLPGVCDGVLPPPEPPVIAVIEAKINNHNTDTEAHADIRGAIMQAINQLPQAVNLRNLDDAQSYISGIVAALKSISLLAFFVLAVQADPVRFGGIDRDAMIETNGVTQAEAQAMIDAAPAYWPQDATPAEYFTYTTNNNAITITGYDEDGGADVRIPSYINGWPVKVIGDGAFQESGIESVHGNVVTIGYEAFSLCGALTTASFPQAATIGTYAFYYCPSLATAPFPQATTIGDGAFYSCPDLATASFPQATTIGDSAFHYCPGLATAPFPQATTIGEQAFYYCASLADITLGTDAANFNATAFNGINANPTITISNPHAKGWGETFAGLAVVRPDLYADAFHGSGANLTGVTKPVDIADRPTFAQVTNVVDAAIDALPATIYSDISAAAAATAVIVSNTPIYTLSISSASVISNDTSALVFDGNAARWELWVDFAATAALGSTFAANMDFVGCEPELTVTGCYKFAVSTVDGITMQARQTYPTRYEWNDDAGVTMPSFTSETNASVNIIAYSYDQYTFCEVYVKGDSIAIGKTYNILTKAHANGYTVDFVIASGLISKSGDSITFANHSPASWWTQNIHANSRYYAIQKTGTDNTSTARIWARKRRMNELEIKAYEAGWRP